MEAEAFAFASLLADAVGYLGRAESWTECEALTEWDDDLNCRPLDGTPEGDRVRLLAPRTPEAYATERQRIMDDMRRKMLAAPGRRPTERAVEKQLDKALKSKGRKAHTLPERLVDALALDTADYQDRGWSRPPAAREVVYARAPEAAPRVVALAVGRRTARTEHVQPTVARFLLAGRPLPRIEDAVRIGELMRRAALAQFGWETDEAGNRRPLAPWEISGRGADGTPLKDPSHRHAFWLPEDADGDGCIDHVSVFVAGGMNRGVCRALNRITRLWLPSKQHPPNSEPEPGLVKEWRLALEGFGVPADFAGAAHIFGTAREWRSLTPFLASGHLKASGYPGEILRLLKRRGFNTVNVKITELKAINVAGTPRRPVHFHRFRTRGREVQFDAAGTLLRIVFPVPIEGPLAIGYGSHFGLGLSVPDRETDSRAEEPVPQTFNAQVEGEARRC